jgi:ferredoxin
VLGRLRARLGALRTEVRETLGTTAARAPEGPRGPVTPAAPPQGRTQDAAATPRNPSAGPPPAVLHADTASTTRDAYVARARAAGRPLVPLAGPGRNVAADGTPFHGPLDNESSRAKAAGHVLTVDPAVCIACGTCVEHTDHVFQLPDDGTAIPRVQDGPMDLVQDAIDACPVTCIAWVPTDEVQARGLTAG